MTMSNFINIGAGILASSHASTSKIGIYIILGSLMVQITTFISVMALSRILDNGTYLKSGTLFQESSFYRKRFLYVLYVSSTFFMVRSVLRLAEVVEGFEVGTLRHEASFYIFDELPMASAMALFNYWYPSSFSERIRKILDEKSVDSILVLSSVVVDST